jgi:hypothetical protein
MIYNASKIKKIVFILVTPVIVAIKKPRFIHRAVALFGLVAIFSEFLIDCSHYLVELMLYFDYQRRY